MQQGLASECYCMSLKWCRCYQFHYWLWMLNMRMSRSKKMVLYYCTWKMEHAVISWGVKFWEIDSFLGPPCAFSIVCKDRIVDRRWKWTIAIWYACITEPRKLKIWLTRFKIEMCQQVLIVDSSFIQQHSISTSCVTSMDPTANIKAYYYFEDIGKWLYIYFRALK